MDAIYRFVQALDSSNEGLLRSAFTVDGVLDLSGLNASMGEGEHRNERKGVESIVDSVLAHVGAMDSGHHLSNFRVKMDENQTVAEVTCYAIAQHFKANEGQDPTKRDYLIMGNSY